LGGDLYDFYDVGENLLGLAVGDASGKGVPAALYGAFASGTVRARAFQKHAPAELLYRVNRTLRRRGVEGFFCTLAFALFDFGSRSLRLANSGLPYPLLYRAASGRCEVVELGGLPLGAFDASSYEERVLHLSPGDLVVFHTDGISDAHDGRESFGAARLQQLVEAHATLPPALLGERILEAMDRFLGGAAPADDLTLIVVKVL
jgi:sigma-B regulation protein RsbU (phosphoserine phosphatase)